MSRALACLVPLVAFAVGCSGESTNLQPVTGKVLLNDRPAAGAMIVFHPRGDDSITAIRPSGRVNDDGTYTLYSGPGDEGKGAPPGEYDVAITLDVPPPSKNGKLTAMSGGEAKETVDALAGKYSDSRTSGLKATVLGGPTEVPTFNLK
jgi:hypothetical protein